MFCALSGETPEEPVASKKSGHLFEKRLILKYIADNGRDPVNGEELGADDLLPLNLTNKVVKPRPPTASSIPNLLLSLQNEWDSVMLETFQLKQQYHNARQELSNALYENDAAKRVIARLIKERDEARAALAAVQANFGQTSAAPEDRMEVDEHHGADDVLIKDVHAKLDAKAAALSKVRRKRKPASSCASVDEVRGFTKITEVEIKAPLSLDLYSGKLAGETREWALAGLQSGQAHIVDWRNGNHLIAKTPAHKKKINDTIWHSHGDNVRSGHFFTASADKTVKFFGVEQGGNDSFHIDEKYTSKTHSAEVNALTLHTTGDYIVSASADGTWAFLDVDTGRSLFRVAQSEGGQAYTAAQFHPDGLILATGTNDSLVRLWDVKSQNNVRSFEGHKGKITGISFSENGYYLATSAADEAVVKFWDLRKLVNFQTIEIEAPKGTGVQSVQFDFSGQYIGAACGQELRIYLVKQWDELCNLSYHTANISDFKFGTDARYVLSAGMDGKIVAAGISS
ncbi:uncharacterized protein SPPG_02775 [Spizellomyces punctatus DAOM BR117]|uniref:Pre-mRNA-processing factor 19 n=1 Tax=Spizellomyces punctatus (strain DAOM BR117) TaxID=645134 RepID=A0A0L0HLJ1_SPIPD|nr:uncharacterized protein SPPG_02775 [Spizellomyces punctatus DAOM BR117]KND02301.1 hypothetical protein SPPG_02775 [Spizellomyces punctatus DAOM BR117]|eukprot:XP_016610340.1 hypothetical protein SPPG_02775 [Spizellomyces punctatus DAOM BR117]